MLTDQYGKITLTLQILKGWIGTYTVNFFTQGQYTDILIFTAIDFLYQDFTKFSMQVIVPLT